MTVVFAGGGTGGHLYPAIALADALRDRAEIAFVGSADRLERTIVPNAGYRLYTVAARPLQRKVGWQLVATAAANARGFVASLGLLRRLRPSILIATGGYVCFPVVVAAKVRRVLRLPAPRIALLEPNAVPGLTSRLLAPLVDEVWGAFPPADARRTAKFVRTGVPVRANLEHLPERASALARLGLRSDRKTLMVVGGSQGARTINDAVIGLLAGDRLPPQWQVLHLTGDAEFDRVRSALGGNSGASALRPYLSDVADAYAAADLVLARAGASTLGELIAVGRPAVLVPYPFAAEDHQTRNAAALAATGAAVVVADRSLDAERLAEVLHAVCAPERLSAMRAAAERLAAESPTATILARIDALLARRTLA